MKRKLSKWIAFLFTTFVFIVIVFPSTAYAAETGGRITLQDTTLNLSGTTYINTAYICKGTVTINGNGGTLVWTGGSGVNDSEGNFYCPIIIHGGTTTIQNLTIDANGGGDTSCAGCVLVGWGNVILENCTFKGAYASSDLNLVFGNVGSTITAKNCTFIGTNKVNRGIGSGGNVTACDCTFQNAAAGIHVNGRGSSNDSLTASGNTIWDCTSGIEYKNGTSNGNASSISGNTIYHCTTGVYLEAGNGGIDLNDNDIYSNASYGIQVVTGKVTVSSGNIHSNSIGILNTGSATLLQSAISFGTGSDANRNYDVYHEGSSYQMSGKATGYRNGVYLASGKYIEIIGALTCDDGAIPLTLASNTVGGLVARCSYSSTQDTANAMLMKFTLTGWATQKSNRNAILRAWVGTNPNSSGYGDGDIVLSAEYLVSYEGTLTNSHITYDLPEQQTIYWSEVNTVTTGVATIYYDGAVFPSLVNSSWYKKSDNTTGVAAGNDITFSASESTSDQVLLMSYNAIVDVGVDGNEQSTGENYQIRGFVSNETPLPENTFGKVGVHDYTYWDDDADDYVTIDETTNYSFQGWDKGTDAIYSDKSIQWPNETMDFTEEIIATLNAGEETFDENGRMEVFIYVVWDEYPIFTENGDLSVMVDGIDAITEEELLALVGAADREDGDDVSIAIFNFDRESLKEITNVGYGSVTFVATDGAGNESYRTVKVYVSNPSASDLLAEGECYGTRFIAKQYYGTHDESSGGLAEDDKWECVEELRTELENAFANLENDTPISIWQFKHEQVLEVQAYVETNGIGDYNNTGSLRQFYDTFEDCRVYADDET